ncbi:MAG: hypothetical protein ACM3IJ_01565 [Candidatus Levyibacteriota bacterium]
MSLSERTIREFKHKQEYESGNFTTIDPESLLDDPAVHHYVAKFAPDKNRNMARDFSRSMQSATPEDIAMRLHHQEIRKGYLQRTGQMGKSWQNRKNIYKRASF